MGTQEQGALVTARSSLPVEDTTHILMYCREARLSDYRTALVLKAAEYQSRAGKTFDFKFLTDGVDKALADDTGEALRRLADHGIT